MEEYIKILEFKGYHIEVNDGWTNYALMGKDNILCHYVEFDENKIKIECLDQGATTVYDTGFINLDINEFRMLLDLFWREYETDN